MSDAKIDGLFFSTHGKIPMIVPEMLAQMLSYKKMVFD